MTQEEIQAKALEKVSEQVKAALAKAEEQIKAGIKPDLDDIRAKAEAWKAEAIKGNKAMQDQIDNLQVDIKKLKAEGHPMPALQGVRQVMEKALKGDEGLAEFAKKKWGTRHGAELEIKSAGTMTFSASTTGQVVDNVYIPGIFGDVRRPRRMRIPQFFPQGTFTGDAVPYVKQTGSDGAAGTTTEGSAKNQIDKDISLVESRPVKITAYMRVSNEMLNDIAALASFLAFQATEDILDVKDTQILYGDGTTGNLEGITMTDNVLTATDVPVTFSIGDTNNWDCILAAAAALSVYNFEPDTVLVNPSDYYQMIGTKGDNGQYVSPFVWNNGNLFLRNIPIYPTTAVTAGSFVTGEFMRGAMVMQREGLSVRFFDQDQDNAIKNLVTIVLEERVALPVPYEQAFFSDTFANVRTRIAT